MYSAKPIERTRDGDFRLRLSDGERALLRQLPATVESLLAGGADDPALRRLFPPAYADDPEADAEFQRLMRDELLGGRVQALRLLAETADRDRLTADELDLWLGALNDLRLVLGTKLDVTEETFAVELDPRDPRGEELALYAYLSWLQEHAVEAAAQ